MILLCTCAASSAAFISSSSPSILRPSKHLDSSGVVCFAKKKSGATKKKPATSAARGFGASPTKAVKASPAARSTSATGDERWRAFEAWLAKSGATCDAVTLADCDGLRGVVTTRSVKAGEELLRIPRSIILDVARADASPVGGLWADVAEPLPGYARLALAVLYEKRLGDESSLLPYVELLPSATELLDGGGPAATWTDDELARTECGKLVADATRLRTRRDGGGHPALQPEALAARWQALGLAGSAPTADEVAWAVTVVTSRAYTIQEDAADVDGPVMSGLIPMVDMANHDGKLPPLTAKGIEPDGKNFVVLATAPMRKGAQVFLSYGPLPNMLLLQQWGFVLPQLASPPDMALVDISTWLEPGGEVAAALGCAAEEGKLMRERDGAPSAWQPVGPGLRLAMEDAAAAGAAPPEPEEPDAAAAAEDDAERGTRLYLSVIRRQLASFSTSAAEDLDALTAEEAKERPCARTVMALQLRRSQKAILNREVAATVQPKPRAKGL